MGHFLHHAAIRIYSPPYFWCALFTYFIWLMQLRSSEIPLLEIDIETRAAAYVRVSTFTYFQNFLVHSSLVWPNSAPHPSGIKRQEFCMIIFEMDQVKIIKNLERFKYHNGSKCTRKKVDLTSIWVLHKKIILSFRHS